MRISEISLRLKKTPYLKSFKLFGQKSLKKRFELMDSFSTWLSGDNIEEFYRKYLENTEYGKKIAKNLKQSKKAERLIERIKFLHTSCPTNLKSRYMSLLSVAYRRTELMNFGFKVSTTQYNNSKKHAEKSFIELFKGAKKSKNTQWEEIVYSSLLKNSSDRVDITKSGKSIYYLLKTKKQIYMELKNENSNLKMGLSTFYKLCGKNFKKPTKKTDLCPICESGKSIKKGINTSVDEQEKMSLTNEYNFYKMHLELAENQKNIFKDQKENVKEGECIIVMDFKQNMNLGGSSRETSRDFYNKSNITVFGVCLIYKLNGLASRKYVNFLSENLSHDSFFVKEALDKLLEQDLFRSFISLKFWSDCGNHFRSKELIYYILKVLPIKHSIPNIEQNFFAEYHGKNDVDGQFGLLTRWFKDGENVSTVKNIDDLKNLFVKESERLNSVEKSYFFLKFSPKKREKNYTKMKMRGFKIYLSYRYISGETSCSAVSKRDRTYKAMEVTSEKVEDKRKTRVSLKPRIIKTMGTQAKIDTLERYTALYT